MPVGNADSAEKWWDQDAGPRESPGPFEHYRWNWTSDLNYDGIFTITDVWLIAKWIFFIPGDFVVGLLILSGGVGVFLELSTASYGGWLAGIVSALIWFFCLGFFGLISDP